MINFIMKIILSEIRTFEIGKLLSTPAGIYMLKVNNSRCDVFIVGFEHISHLVLVFYW